MPVHCYDDLISLKHEYIFSIQNQIPLNYCTLEFNASRLMNFASNMKDKYVLKLSKKP